MTNNRRARLWVSCLLVLWSAWGFSGSHVEQAEYRVLEKKADYEIREFC